MAGSETLIFEKIRTLLSIDSLKDKTLLSFKLSIDRSVRIFSKMSVSEPATIARKLLATFSPEVGDLSGTLPLPLQEKAVFSSFQDHLRIGASSLRAIVAGSGPGTLGDLSVFRIGRSLPVGDLPKNASFVSSLE